MLADEVIEERWVVVKSVNRLFSRVEPLQLPLLQTVVFRALLSDQKLNQLFTQHFIFIIKLKSINELFSVAQTSDFQESSDKDLVIMEVGVILQVDEGFQEALEVQVNDQSVAFDLAANFWELHLVDRVVGEQNQDLVGPRIRPALQTHSSLPSIVVQYLYLAPDLHIFDPPTYYQQDAQLLSQLFLFHLQLLLSKFHKNGIDFVIYKGFPLGICFRKLPEKVQNNLNIAGETGSALNSSDKQRLAILALDFCR